MYFKLQQQPYFVRQMVREFEKDGVMTVARCRKKKLNKDEAYVRQATYLHMAIMLRNLHEAFDVSKEELRDIIEGHVCLIEEASDGRNTVDGIMRDTFLLTGINVKQIIDEAFDGRKR